MTGEEVAGESRDAIVRPRATGPEDAWESFEAEEQDRAFSVVRKHE
jgi:hypothetical protein